METINKLQPIQFIEQLEINENSWCGITAYINGFRMVSAVLHKNEFIIEFNGLISSSIYPTTYRESINFNPKKTFDNIPEVKLELEKIINKYFNTFIL